jgi:hypothetical protein
VRVPPPVVGAAPFPPHPHSGLLPNTRILANAVGTEIFLNIVAPSLLSNPNGNSELMRR